MLFNCKLNTQFINQKHHRRQISKHLFFVERFFKLENCLLQNDNCLYFLNDHINFKKQCGRDCNSFFFSYLCNDEIIKFSCLKTNKIPNQLQYCQFDFHDQSFLQEMHFENYNILKIFSQIQRVCNKSLSSQTNQPYQGFHCLVAFYGLTIAKSASSIYLFDFYLSNLYFYQYFNNQKYENKNLLLSNLFCFTII